MSEIFGCENNADKTKTRVIDPNALAGALDQRGLHTHAAEVRANTNIGTQSAEVATAKKIESQLIEENRRELYRLSQQPPKIRDRKRDAHEFSPEEIAKIKSIGTKHNPTTPQQPPRK